MGNRRFNFLPTKTHHNGSGISPAKYSFPCQPQCSDAKFLGRFLNPYRNVPKQSRGSVELTTLSANSPLSLRRVDSFATALLFSQLPAPQLIKPIAPYQRSSISPNSAHPNTPRTPRNPARNRSSPNPASCHEAIQSLDWKYEANHLGLLVFSLGGDRVQGFLWRVACLALNFLNILSFQCGVFHMESISADRLSAFDRRLVQSLFWVRIFDILKRVVASGGDFFFTVLGGQALIGVGVA